ARIDVLEDPREDVMGTGPAVGRRRPLVEAPERRALAVRQRAREDLALAPALQDALLELGKGLLRIDWAESRHERRILAAARGAPSRAQPASVRQRHRAVVLDGPARVVRDLPGVAVRVDEDA